MRRRRSCGRGGAAGLCAVLAIAGCSDDGEGAATTEADVDTVITTTESWEALVADVAAESPGVPGVAVAVIAPGVDVAVAAGTAGDDGSSLTPDHPFRISSNTKTFTAAAVLRLVEEGTIGLDDSLAALVDEGLLDPTLVELLAGDGYDVGAIIVQHLLGHTSGLYDYAADVDYQTFVLGAPDQHWERADQVAFAIEHGNPLGQPGEVYAYSDTGYVLLGNILERATDGTLGAALRGLLGFAELGVDSTWLETVEPPPAGVPERAQQFYETQDMSVADPSFDLYGGGGLVSTVADLASFARALLRGEVFDDPRDARRDDRGPAGERGCGGGDGAVPLRSPLPRIVLVEQRLLGNVRHRLSGRRRHDRCVGVPSEP